MRSERFGLWLVGASLVAIAVVSVFLVQHQAETVRAHVRSQGVGMVRLLSGLPVQQLRGERSANPLRQLLDVGAGSGLGYAVVVDLQGQPLADAVAPGTIVPPAQFDDRPAGWFGEHMLESPGDGRRVREFFGPILDRGDLAGFVRLGFFDSALPLNSHLLPLLGAVALPVFLLVPLFHFLMRREVRPLADLANKLEAATSTAGPVILDMSGELRDFVGRVSQFVEGAQKRIRELEGERSASTTANRLLAYRRDKAEAILQALPEAVIVLDDTGTATFANRKVQALVGSEVEEILGRPAQEWCQDTALLAYLSGFGHPSAMARRSESFEYSPVAAPDRRVGLASFPLFSPQDPRAVLGTLVVLRDTTREHRVRDAGAEFVAHVSHELKTPLNVIAMYSELLMGEEGRDEALRVEATNAIHDNVERMGELIRNLLSISKLEAGSLTLERQRVRLNDLLADLLQSTSSGARGAGLRFQLRVTPELPPLMLDKGLFSIAVKNLLTNAIKYNRPAGSVVLAAEETDEHIVIRVTDTGIGIEPADQARVFDKFFRSSASEVLERSGHGLGLYLTREIVALHQGSLTVRSEPGTGSEFLITLKKSQALLKETL